MVKASRAAASQLIAMPISITDSRLSTAPGWRHRIILDASRGDRTAAGAAHLGVDVGLVPHVEGARGPGPDGDAETWRWRASSGWIDVRAATQTRVAP
jgi:hypothetical protein